MPHRLKAQLITQRGHATTEFRPVVLEFTLTREQKRLVFLHTGHSFNQLQLSAEDWQNLVKNLPGPMP